MQQIAERLNCQEVQYNDNTAMWTKHMIHRILVCKKYCSGEKLPVLITTDIFQQACILRMRKTEYHARSVCDTNACNLCMLFEQGVFQNKR